MRRIGRVRRLASPSNVTVIGQPATAPIARRQPVPELPKSSAADGSAKPPTPTPSHPPGPLAGALDHGAQRLHGVGGADGVLALQHAGDAGFADRQRAQDQGAQRNRLVAGHADAAAQRPERRAVMRRRRVEWHGGLLACAPDWPVTRTWPHTTLMMTLLTAALPAAKGSTTFLVIRTFQGFPNRGKTRARHEASAAAVAARKFYDLSKDPIVCPNRGEIVADRRAADAAARARRSGAAPRLRPQPRSRSRAEVRAGERRARLARGRRRRGQQGKKAPAADVDAIEERTTTSRSRRPRKTTFIEEQEEGDDDVTDIIGEGIEKEEET